MYKNVNIPKIFFGSKYKLVLYNGKVYIKGVFPGDDTEKADKLTLLKSKGMNNVKSVAICIFGNQRLPFPYREKLKDIRAFFLTDDGDIYYIGKDIVSDKVFHSPIKLQLEISDKIMSIHNHDHNTILCVSNSKVVQLNVVYKRENKTTPFSTLITGHISMLDHKRILANGTLYADYSGKNIITLPEKGKIIKFKAIHHDKCLLILTDKGDLYAKHDFKVYLHAKHDFAGEINKIAEGVSDFEVNVHRAKIIRGDCIYFSFNDIKYEIYIFQKDAILKNGFLDVLACRLGKCKFADGFSARYFNSHGNSSIGKYKSLSENNFYFKRLYFDASIGKCCMLVKNNRGRYLLYNIANANKPDVRKVASSELETSAKKQDLFSFSIEPELSIPENNGREERFKYIIEKNNFFLQYKSNLNRDGGSVNETVSILNFNV